MKQQQWQETVFPKIIEADATYDLSQYLANAKAQIDADLAKAGAILFRGFHVPTIDDFDFAVEAYGEKNFPYADSLSNAVRINLTQRVFTANEAPPETSIFLHHEMAQTPIYPSKLFFYCNIAADEGGATPLCRSDILLQKMDAENKGLVEDFIAKGVRYTHTMPAQDDARSGQGRSWRSTLGVEDIESAEQRLHSLSYDWQWMDDDALRVTSARLDAVRTLSDGRRTFFNQLIAAYRGWADQRNDPSKSICFGDGSSIDADQMRVPIDLADTLSFDLEWQSGDVALIDNFLVMHGRRPFKGTRKVLASLIK
ncbi:TauD/TfdA family dioxygenase [Parasphingorhabdus cellanae]|uniref:TauD/TfdA family dioxygenase n=1 Tax=Parasphingorhabdus cellanae TaxID=2806553 RepID=A0ABX7T5M7_9SPHN|nr:TauD/TfdA family dioxygenase [Parasphingorhabdus cellanae]QTD55288.1 TauD/TfdA family dioxygenase [Parasphingorhabdus cellanae]